MAEKNKNLEQELKYYIDNQDELVKKYEGRHLVIKNQEVVGDYDTSTDAYLAASEKYEVGTFLIQYCSRDKSSYKQVYHSRVTFY